MKFELQKTALKNKDKNAWTEVYEHYADSVYQYAYYRLFGNKSTAEDITQEVFIRAIDSIGTFKGELSELLHWLKGICKRTIYQRHRANGREAGFLSLSSEELQPVEISHKATKEMPPDRSIIKMEEQMLIGGALSELPSHWEQVLRWKYCENLRVAVIADRMSMTEKAVESLLSRARNAFKEAYLRISQDNGRSHKAEEVQNEQ